MKFIFVKIDTLGSDLDCLFNTWHMVADSAVVAHSVGVADVIGKIYDLPVEQITFTYILGIDVEEDAEEDAASGAEEPRVISIFEAEHPGQSSNMSSGANLGKQPSIAEKILIAKRKRPDVPTCSASIGSRDTAPTASGVRIPILRRSDVAPSAPSRILPVRVRQVAPVPVPAAHDAPTIAEDPFADLDIHLPKNFGILKDDAGSLFPNLRKLLPALASFFGERNIIDLSREVATSSFQIFTLHPCIHYLKVLGGSILIPWVDPLPLIVSSGELGYWRRFRYHKAGQ